MIKKLFLSILFSLEICHQAFAVELLIQAVDSPYDKGGKIGDVIVVRPDGWQWGREECPPKYIIYHVDDMTYEEAKQYEEPLMDTTDPEHPVLIRLRKNYIPSDDVDEAKNNNGVIYKTKDDTLKKIKIKTSKIKNENKTQIATEGD